MEVNPRNLKYNILISSFFIASDDYTNYLEGIIYFFFLSESNCNERQFIKWKKNNPQLQHRQNIKNILATENKTHYYPIDISPVIIFRKSMVV